MGKYGKAAIRATSLLGRGSVNTPSEAWSKAVCEIFPDSKSSQKKGCPRGAFLGLCEEGLVSGVLPGEYTKSRDNKRYAIDAIRILNQQPSLAIDRDELWKRVMKGVAKIENSQMDVVVALWDSGLIVQRKV